MVKSSLIIYTIQHLGQAILCSLQKVLAVICFIWLANYLLFINANMIKCCCTLLLETANKNSTDQYGFITPATRGRIATLLFRGHQNEMCHFNVVSHMLCIYVCKCLLVSTSHVFKLDERAQDRTLRYTTERKGKVFVLTAHVLFSDRFS